MVLRGELTMIDTVYHDITRALQQPTIQAADAVLAKYRSVLKDRLTGANLYVLMLFRAIKEANQQVVEFLLEVKKMPEFKFQQHFGYTPFGLACKLDCHALLPILLKHSDKNFAMYVASKFSRTKAVSLLAKYKTMFNRKLLGFIASSTK